MSDPGRPTARTLTSQRIVAAVVLLGSLLVAITLRIGALAPAGLWLDDAWVGVVMRADTLSEVLLASSTAPALPVLVAASAEVLGVSTLAAQLPALVLGLLGVVAAGLVALRLGAGAAAAGAVSLLVAASPAHVIYSTRVKQFTADVAVALLLTLAVVAWLRRPSSAGRAAVVLLVGVAGTVLSAASAFAMAAATAAMLVGALQVHLRERAAGAPDEDVAGRHRPLLLAVSVGLLYGAFALPWWAWVSDRLPPGLSSYWDARYLPLDDPALALDRLAVGTTTVSRALVGWPAIATLAVVALGAVAAATSRSPARRPVALLVLLPGLAFVVAAALQAAPWGTGRTELLLLASVSVAAACLLAEIRDRGGPAAEGVGAVVLAVAVLLTVRGQPVVTYPDTQMASLVEVADSRDGPLVVYAQARWGHALVTPARVRLEVDRDDSFGFRAVLEGEDVVVLPPGVAMPSIHARSVASLRARGVEGFDLLVAHAASDLDVLRQELQEQGYERRGRLAAPGARLFRYERRAIDE